jgi:hypothetical protein
VESLISNKGAKIKEIENLYGVIKQEGKLGFCSTQANIKTKDFCIKS